MLKSGSGSKIFLNTEFQAAATNQIGTDMGNDSFSLPVFNQQLVTNGMLLAMGHEWFIRSYHCFDDIFFKNFSPCFSDCMFSRTVL